MIPRTTIAAMTAAEINRAMIVAVITVAAVTKNNSAQIQASKSAKAATVAFALFRRL
jgi:hypothetical protein